MCICTCIVGKIEICSQIVTSGEHAVNVQTTEIQPTVDLLDIREQFRLHGGLIIAEFLVSEFPEIEVGGEDVQLRANDGVRLIELLLQTQVVDLRLYLTDLVLVAVVLRCAE